MCASDSVRWRTEEVRAFLDTVLRMLIPKLSSRIVGCADTWNTTLGEVWRPKKA